MESRRSSAPRSGYFADMLRIHQAERENTPELGDGVSFATMVTFSGGGSGAEVLDPGSNRLSEGKALFHVQELAGQFSLENILTALNGREGGTPLVSYSTGGSGGNTGEKPARDWTLDTLFGGNTYTPSSGVGIVSTGNQAVAVSPHRHGGQRGGIPGGLRGDAAAGSAHLPLWAEVSGTGDRRGGVEGLGRAPEIVHAPKRRARTSPWGRFCERPDQVQGRISDDGSHCFGDRTGE